MNLRARTRLLEGSNSCELSSQTGFLQQTDRFVQLKRMLWAGWGTEHLRSDGIDTNIAIKLWLIINNQVWGANRRGHSVRDQPQEVGGSQFFVTLKCSRFLKRSTYFRFSSRFFFNTFFARSHCTPCSKPLSTVCNEIGPKQKYF